MNLLQKHGSIILAVTFASFGLASGPPLLTATAVAASSKTASADRQVAVIRQQVVAINSAVSKMSRTTIDVDNVSLEGTSATYYRTGKAIRKISATVFGETYQDKIDLYYLNGRLIFVLDKHSTYEAGLGSPVDQVTDYRLYFLNGKPALVLDGTKQATAEVSAELATSMTDVSVTLLEAVA